MIGEWVTDVVPENGSRPYVSTTAPLGLADRDGASEGGFLETSVGTGFGRPKIASAPLGTWQNPALPCKSLQDIALGRSPGTMWRCGASCKQESRIGAATNW